MNDLEQELRNGLHGAADHVSVDPSAGGRQRIAERVTQRADRRRRRGLAGGGVIAVGALVAGVWAMQPEDSTKLQFGDDATTASPPAQGVVTGSMTGSMTGSARGWSSTYADDLGTLSLPHFVLSPAPGYVPSWVSSVSARRGTGGTPAPLAVVTGTGSTVQYVVASVQTPDTLGPGRGGLELDIDGRHARIVSEGAKTTLIWDLSSTQRVLAVSTGLARAQLVALLPTLHQVDGTWTFEPAADAGLRDVNTTPADVVQSRSISWAEGLPRTVDGSIMNDSSGWTLEVNSGGAYEYYARLGARWTQAGAVQTPVSLTLPGGHVATGFLTVQDSGVSAVVLDDRGLVLDLQRYLDTGQPKLTAADVQRVFGTISEASDAQWVDLATQSVAWQAAMNQAAEKVRGSDLAKKAAPPEVAVSTPPSTPGDPTVPTTGP